MLEKQPNGLVDIELLKEQTEYLLSIDDLQEIEGEKLLAQEVEEALRRHANLLIERLSDNASATFLFDKARLIRKKFLGPQFIWSKTDRIHYSRKYREPVEVDSCDAIDEEAPFKIIGCISGTIFQCLFGKKIIATNGIFVVASHDREEEDSKLRYYGPPCNKFRKKKQRSIRSDRVLGHLLRYGMNDGMVSNRGQIHLCETYEDTREYFMDGALTMNPEFKIGFDTQSVLCDQPEAIASYVRHKFLDRIIELERIKKDELLATLHEAF